jgi:phage-related protein
VSAKPVKVGWVSDSTQLRADMPKVEAAMDSAAATAQKAGAKIDSALDSTANHADAVASKGAQAGGALSGLGSLVGGPFGAAMMTGGTAMTAFADAGDLVNVVTESAIVRKIKDTAVTIGQTASTIAHTVASKAAAAASKVWAAGQWLLNAALTANPLGLVVVAVVALVAAIVIAYKKSETFRNIVSGAFSVVRNAAEAVASFFLKWTLPGIILSHADTIKGVFDGVVNFVKGLPGRITQAASGMWDGIRDGFRDALNWIIDKWNNFHITIPSIDLGPLGSIGGGTIDFPDIPRLASGGIVTRPTFALIGEAGPEAVIPLNRGLMATTIHVVLTGEQQDGIARGRRYQQDIDLAGTQGLRRYAP